jgi:hypothetical protein
LAVLVEIGQREARAQHYFCSTPISAKNEAQWVSDLVDAITPFLLSVGTSVEGCHVLREECPSHSGILRAAADCCARRLRGNMRKTTLWLGSWVGYRS